AFPKYEDDPVYVPIMCIPQVWAGRFFVQCYTSKAEPLFVFHRFLLLLESQLNLIAVFSGIFRVVKSRWKALSDHLSVGRSSRCLLGQALDSEFHRHESRKATGI